MTHAHKSAHWKLRGFQLVVKPSGPDAYGVTLLETNADAEKQPRLVVRLDARRTRRVMESLMGAARSSGQPKTVLSAQRTRPVLLSEEAGVRLALALLATAPISKIRRVDAMTDAVDSLTTEESYYWYARCMGEEAARTRRALRLFLAAE